MPKCSVVIVAAGIGKRMGADVYKQYMLLENKPILAHTLEKFEKASIVDEIIVVTNKEEIEYCKKDIVDKYGFKKVANIVVGDNERQYSVFNGIKSIISTDIVLIHDGVRPFIQEKNIYDVYVSASRYGACTLGVRAKETIKVCDEKGFVISTPNRADLWQIQTPQGFKYDVILNAHIEAESQGILASDDTGLVEKLGVSVKVVEGNYSNIKITTPEDFDTAKLFVNKY